MSDRGAQPSARQSGPIAYVMQSFPLLTETFIYREIWGLEHRGPKVATFATWKPDEKKLPPEAMHFVDRTTYVFPISWIKFVRAHLYFLGRHPRKYVSTLLFTLTRKGESLRNRFRTFLHFCEAVYLADEMKAQQVRHIHAHFCINAATIALVISRLLDIPFSFTAHNILFTDRVILKEKIRAACFIAAISHFTRQRLMGLVPDDPVEDKIHIVHCGISPGAFAPFAPKPVNDSLTLLFVAQLCERKGAPILVEACRILVERGVKFRCVIVGDGPQRALVEELVEHYSLQRNIELTGAVFQQRIQSYLQQSDVFVLPCLTTPDGDMDGVPVSLMEAMAVEIAAISTRVSGIPELIEDGVSGLLVPEQDPLALADALQSVLEDDELRLRLGENGRHRIMRDFNIEESVRQLAALFENCVQADEGLE